MNVGVDEAGHEGLVAEVEDFCACWVRDSCADFLDAIAVDEDLTGGEKLAGGDVEQARGVEDDEVSGLGLLGERVGEAEADDACAEESLHGSRSIRETLVGDTGVCCMTTRQSDGTTHKLEWAVKKSRPGRPDLLWCGWNVLAVEG